MKNKMPTLRVRPVLVWIATLLPISALLAMAFYASPVWHLFEQVANMQVARFAGCPAFWEIAQGWDQRDGRFRPVFNYLICLEAQTSPLTVELVRMSQVAFLVLAGAYLLKALGGASHMAFLTFSSLIILTFASIPGLWQSISNTWYAELTGLCFVVLGLVSRRPSLLLLTALLATFTKESFGVWLLGISLLLIWRRELLWSGLAILATASSAWLILSRQNPNSYPVNQLSPLREGFSSEVATNIIGLSSSMALPLLGVTTVLFVFKLAPKLQSQPLVILGSGLALALISVLHGTFRIQYVLDVTDIHALPSVYLIVLGILSLASPGNSVRVKEKLGYMTVALTCGILFVSTAWEARGSHLSSRNLSLAVKGLLDWVNSGNPRNFFPYEVALPKQVAPNAVSAYFALDERFTERNVPDWLWGDDPRWAKAKWFVRLTPADAIPDEYELYYPAGEVGGIYSR